MHAYEPAPEFFDDVDQFLAAPDLNVLRDNVAIVDMLSYRAADAFDSSAGLDTNTPLYYSSASDIRIWKGKLRYRAGMTSLTIEGTAANAGSSQIKLSINGAPAPPITPTSMWSASYTLVGYTDGQIIPIEVRVSGTRPANASYVVSDIYAGPIVFATAWPGVPTFATTWSAALLAQLGAAAQWCYDRMALSPFVARPLPRYQIGPFKPLALEPLYYGAFQRNFSADVIHVAGQVINKFSPGIRLKIFVNGALVTTSATWGVGTTSFDLTAAFPSGVALGSRAVVSLFGEVTSSAAIPAGLPPNSQSRWSFTTLRSDGGSGGYPYATLPSAFSFSGTTSATTIRDRLNTLAGVVSAAKARIDANPQVWNYVRAQRSWYGQDDNTRGNLDKRARPALLRQGSRLKVTGKGVGLAFGAITLPTNEPGKTEDDHTYSQTHSLIDSDKTETRLVYLDTLADLFPATTYVLTGEVDFAEELA